MTLRPVLRGAALLAVLSLCACSWGILKQKESTPAPVEPAPDVTAPVLRVAPPGGAYAAIQYVSMAADEAATLRYTLDGSDPALAGSTVVAAPSPVFWLRMAEGTTVLRAIAVDAAGNRSAPVRETYAVDLSTPVLTLLEAPAAAVPLLATTSVRWSASEAVTWTAELVVSNAPAQGRTVASGSAAAGVPVALALHGYDLPASAVDRLELRARDGAGKTATLAVPAALLSPPLFGPDVGEGECKDLAVSPAGDRLWFAAGSGITIVDADRASSGFATVVGTLAVPAPAWAVAPAPDGARVWVSLAGLGVAALATADGTVEQLTTVRTQAESVAVSADGKRVWLAEMNEVWELDAEAGATAAPVRLTPDPSNWVLGPGYLVPLAGGRRLAAGQALYDVEKGSPTRGEALAGLPTGIYGLGAAPVASADGTLLYFLDDCAYGTCGVRAWDPVALATVARGVVPYGTLGALPRSLLPTSDGAFLLVLDTAFGLSVLRASDLAVLATLTLQPGFTGVVDRALLAPDGARIWGRAYVGAPGPGHCQGVRLRIR